MTSPSSVFPLTAICLAATALLATGCTTSRPRAAAPAPTNYPEMVNRSIGLYNNDDLEVRVRRLGYQLARTAGQPPERFAFFILDQEMPNAFAAPDGSIYLSRGLLALANNEDAIAGIIAHEMIHLTERHHEKQARRESLPSILLAPGQAIGRLFGNRVEHWLNLPLRDLGTAYVTSHSRAHEFEADHKGARLAAAAGYDPMEMARNLHQMESTTKLLFNRPGHIGYLDTHPPAEERVERITRQAHTLTIRRKARQSAFPEGEEFLKVLDGLCFGPNPAHGIFQGSRFIHPEYGYGFEIPPKWISQKGPNLVGAIAPASEAAFYIGFSHFGFDPSTPATTLKEALFEEFRVLPVEERFRTMDNGSVSSLVYRDRSGDTTAYLFFLWVEVDGRILQLIGSGPEKHYPELSGVIESIHTLAPAEKTGIDLLRLRIVKARAGESLAELGERTKNQWSPAFTAIANDLPTEINFEGGEKIKIVRREQYTTPEPTPPQNR